MSKSGTHILNLKASDDLAKKNRVTKPATVLYYLDRMRDELIRMDSGYLPFLKKDATEIAIRISVLQRKVKRYAEASGKAKE
jgi:hypothetical protein